MSSEIWHRKSLGAVIQPEDWFKSPAPNPCVLFYWQFQGGYSFAFLLCALAVSYVAFVSLLFVAHLLVPREGCASWLWYCIFTYIFA